MDGEDIVQEAVFDAYRKLDTFDDSRRISARLFKIAHNRHIDCFRKRGVRMKAEAVVTNESEEWAVPDLTHGAINIAVENQIIELSPPMREPRILHRFVDRFNMRDWNRLCEPITDDACVRVSDRYWGSLSQAPCFSVYESMPVPWQMTAGQVDGKQ